MLNKTDFPDDWSALTDKQVLENIEYLLNNYKQYEIHKYDDNWVKIGNVSVRHRDGWSGGRYEYYSVNEKLYRDIIGKPITSGLKKLLYIGKEEYDKRQQKQNRRTIIIGCACIFVLLVVTEICLYSLEKKRLKQEEQNRELFKQQVVKETLDSIERSKTIDYPIQNQR